MPRVRKTRNEYVIQGNYGQGWEDVTAADTNREALGYLRDYRDNEPMYAHRLIVRRVRLEG